MIVMKKLTRLASVGVLAVFLASFAGCPETLPSDSEEQPVSWTGQAMISFELPSGPVRCQTDAGTQIGVDEKIGAIRLDLQAASNCPEAARRLLARLGARDQDGPVAILEYEPEVPAVDWLWLGKTKRTIDELLVDQRREAITVKAQFDRGDFGWRDHEIDGLEVGFAFDIEVRLEPESLEAEATEVLDEESDDP